MDGQVRVRHINIYIYYQGGEPTIIFSVFLQEVWWSLQMSPPLVEGGVMRVGVSVLEA